MRATKVDVELLRPDQPHRHWSEIRDRLIDADLDEGVRVRARAVFERLAGAEAHVHGTSVDEVHFHEVGAWDSIADVVGSCAALVDLGIDDLRAGRMSLGLGVGARSPRRACPFRCPRSSSCAGGGTSSSGGDGELATPTGAALVTALASAQAGMPPMSITAVGVGAGSKEQPDRANVVRVVVGTVAGDPPASRRWGGRRSSGDEAAEGTAPMCVLEANVDDLDPRVWPTVIDGLMAAGAADAWTTPITMKRGRPAQLLLGALVA